MTSFISNLHSFFSADATLSTKLLYGFLAAVSIVYSIVAVLAPLITPECHLPLPHPERRLGQGNTGGLEDEPNPSYKKDPCRWIRYAALLGMNKWEAEMSCRVVMSILIGSIIGFERRRADRPAGIRTMAMVSLGSCVFTIDSMFAFVDGTMGWDSSRVSAAIPSGVGFLGAASIWKGAPANKDGDGPATPEIHGLTTATSVWLSAAVGILCGGGLYVPSFFATACGVVYLRFAPRLQPPSAEPPSSPAATDLEELRQPLNPSSQSSEIVVETVPTPSKERSSSQGPASTHSLGSPPSLNKSTSFNTKRPSLMT